MKDINIVDEFLNSYYRSPTKKEFILLGGDIKTVEKSSKAIVIFWTTMVMMLQQEQRHYKC